jgi:hypothetical protein
LTYPLSLRKPFIGKYSCGVCDYTNDDEFEIKKHLDNLHVGHDKTIRDRYNRVRGLE